MDIDDLKVVNNGLGHLVGDQLIIQMGEPVRRRARLPATCSCAPVATSSPSCARSRCPGDPLDDLAERLLLSAAEPFLLDNRPVSVSVSIGAAESDASTQLPGDLLRGADIALQRAKHGGRRQSARFEPGEDKPALERMGIEELLRRSLDNEELVCVFQPITLISTGRVVAAETLVRLRDASGEIVPPSAFLPLAAELGLLGHPDRPGAAAGMRGGSTVAGGRSRDPGGVQRAAAVAERGRDRQPSSRPSRTSASRRRS